MKTETKINQPEWAMEKVRKLSPSTIEKITLLAIARFSTTNGEGCYAKIETLAKYIGRSERTVQYHIRKLEQRGELRVEYQAKEKVRTNKYFISVCRLTTEEREAITGVSRQQIRIPLEQPRELGKTEISENTMDLIKSTLDALRMKVDSI